jgi:hypothetical protein
MGTLIVNILGTHSPAGEGVGEPNSEEKKAQFFKEQNKKILKL